MAGKELDASVIDPPREVEESEPGLKEELHKLKHQMVEMYQAWMKGHPPPSYPANPAFIPPLAQSQEPLIVDLSPQYAPSFTPYHHYHDTTSQTIQAPPAKTTTYPAPSATPIFVAPLPSTLHRSSSELPPKNTKQEEIFRKVKILEKLLRNMLGLGGQVSAAYKDLCLFPDVQLLVGLKMPKFDLYDRHGDPVAHLRGFCSKMRGDDGKDKLLMAYIIQSLSGAALEWYTRQDNSKWYTWDDMAQAFARHFQYNIEIVPDRLSLTKIEKKYSESFREYVFWWIE
ncbi:uncharacterized protein [Nicotiana sylvestris]|uniref:uncharacterized protein n=1 Tax=Nicotiana sylvestris TaxID=4096 RepID=UPI00388C3715